MVQSLLASAPVISAPHVSWWPVNRKLGSVCPSLSSPGTGFCNHLGRQRNLRFQKGIEVSRDSFGEGGGITSSQKVTPGTASTGGKKVKKLLSLSNGHGEDVIATRVLEELQAIAISRGEVLEIEALPLVGKGHAYVQSGFTTVGPSENMPSGGFIYMDIFQLIGDLHAGLLSLTLNQWRTVSRWVEENTDGILIAVGDIFPLALAWLVSSSRGNHKNAAMVQEPPGYAFIGTAKSEFYIRQDDGMFLKKVSVENFFFPGSIYLPWERHMMADRHCRLVVPRDNLTAEYLKQQLPLSSEAKVRYLGNPMMDGLHPTGILNFLGNHSDSRRLILLPGSREPEVHSNWRLLLEVSDEVLMKVGSNTLFFLTPIVPSIEPEVFVQALVDFDWQPENLSFLPPGCMECVGAEALDPVLKASFKHPTQQGRDMMQTWPANNGTSIFSFKKNNAVLLLLRGGFSDCAHWAEAGIAMAGTATEQLVGLGKPVFTIAGKGPQFTFAFAEAQSRLLGKSVILCANPLDVGERLFSMWDDSNWMMECNENGERRMGVSGAAKQIALRLWIEFFTDQG